MKVTFTFTDSPDIASLTTDDIYHSYLELPDDVLRLPDCKQRIIEIAQFVSELTNASLHISCKELELKNLSVKIGEPQTFPLRINPYTIVLKFEHLGSQKQQRDLKILCPVLASVPVSNLQRRKRGHRQLTLSECLLLVDRTYWCKTDEDRTYANLIASIADKILVLLNTEVPSSSTMLWTCRGFHPRWRDANLINRREKRQKRYEVEERKRHRQEERLKKTHSTEIQSQSQSSPEPRTGGGRKVGAVPGIFKGVQFRSQLEIRLATELEKRQARWFYEAERLGDGNYLVDFYLPDYKAWIEVKGSFEPRDEYLLKDVAAYLKQERSEKLFVYMQTKAYRVNPSGFKELTREEFWDGLFSLR